MRRSEALATFEWLASHPRPALRVSGCVGTKELGIFAPWSLITACSRRTRTGPLAR